jgi:hypothetical protein
MNQRRKRAAFGDEASWSDTTRMEVERHIRQFLAAAKRDGQSDLHPDEAWLARHIQQIRAKSGRSYARKYTGNVSHHQRRNGERQISEFTLVRAVLHAPDGEDPLSTDLPPEQLGFKLGRAQVFADHAYVAGTYENYASAAKRWVKRCRGLEIDPLLPTLKELEQYFEDVAGLEAYTTVRNRRNALSHYFRKNGVPDLTREPEIERILEGLKRAKRPERIRPISADERRAILAGLEREGAGVRDRVAVLLTAFTSMGAERLSLIDAEHCHVMEDGVKIDSLGEAPFVWIGQHDVRDLDLVYWLGRLLEMIPSSGPIFRPVLARRMRFGEARMSKIGILGLVADAARRAGAPSKNISARLRALFDAETRPFQSPVLLAHDANRVRVKEDRSERERASKVQIRSGRRPAFTRSRT